MKVPVVIVNWNGYHDTVECIDSVFETTEVHWEIHLIDNGSDNKEGVELEERYRSNDRVIIYQSKKNLGFGGANNYILQSLLDVEEYRFIALLNNDTTVHPEWLQKMVKGAIKEDAQMISAKMLNYYDRTRIDNLGHQMLNTGEIIPIAHGESAEVYQKSFSNLGSCAGATLYSTEMLREIGVFDSFFNTGYEDAELGLRATLAGYRSVLIPEAIIYHKGGQSIRKIFDKKYAKSIQVSIWYTYFKLMPTGAILISMPFIFVKIALLTFINILFLRRSYLQIQWSAISETVFKHRREIQKKRIDFYRSINTIDSWQILLRQRFFLWYDLKRFYHIFIKGQKSALDQYGGE